MFWSYTVPFLTVILIKVTYLPYVCLTLDVLVNFFLVNKANLVHNFS